MKTRKECDVEVRIHHETDKAYLVSNDMCPEKTWVPKMINGVEYAVDEGLRGWAVFTVPEWWAAEKGLV